MSFDENLMKLQINDNIIEEIMNVDYPNDKSNPKQDYANFMSAAMQKCEELLDYDTISEVMYDRSCCKSGSRLNNSRKFAKEHSNKTLEEKLKLLHDVRYMGKPYINKDGDIETLAVGSYSNKNMTCPCWYLSNTTPTNGPMPLSYCKCCGGHFKFHYQKALGIKLRLKEVVSSILNSEGNKPCVFIYEIASNRK